MKFILLILIPFILYSNADRALYLKKYSKEKKTALVIGNSKYSGSLSKLSNPINDALDVKNSLEKIGFDVILLLNANQEKTDENIRMFTHKLKSSAVGLFYFAGHGVEVDKENYLIPVGSKIDDKYSIKYKTIAVNEVVDRMQNSGTRLNMVILDACRNDPFSRGGGGLSPMSQAKGTLIAYATDSGKTASENASEKNGLYTKHFLNTLNEYNLNQRDFFHKIRTKVYNESEGKQLPYLNDGTIGDFYFKVNNIKASANKGIIDTKPYVNYLSVDNKVWQDEEYTRVEAQEYKYMISSEGKAGDWNHAKQYCEDLQLGNYSDWYLPEEDELLKIYKKKDIFKNSVNAEFWSASPHKTLSSAAMIVHSGNGKSRLEEKIMTGYIRCVRDK